VEQEIVLSTGETKRLTLENVRPRLYKAVRATLLASRDPEERSTQLTRWFKDVMAEGLREATFPEELAEAQKKALQAGWQRALIRARRLAGELFQWPDPDFDWVQALSRAVDEAVQNDAAALTRQRLAPEERPPLDEADREALLRHLLRRSWCGETAQPEAFSLTAWLDEVAFLPRRLTEIGCWARLFHTVTGLYREGEAAPAVREQALNRLLAGVSQGEALKFVPEAVIYLEGAVRRREAGEAFPGPLPPPLEPDVFPGQDPDAALALIREALEFLVTGGRKPAMQQRLAWLSEHREFVELRDLLYAFLGAVRESEILPAPSQVLDLLQRRGFPILHQDFRDDYRAWLAPLEEGLREGSATLRWPLDPASVSGDADADLNFAQQQEASRRQALQSFQEGALAFLEGEDNPLPRSEVVRPAATFAVAWTVAAKLGRGEALDAGAIARESADRLAPPLLRLIRPRKGYELKHKSELQHFIEEETATHLDALAAWRRSGHIANLNGDRLLFRLAAARSLERHWPDPAALPEEAVHNLQMPGISQSLAELAAHLKVDPAPAGAPWWHEFQMWLKDRLRWTEILAAYIDAGDEAAAWRAAGDNLFQDLARQAYRLAAARSRSRQGLPPLPGDPGLLPWLAAWLTPLSSSLKSHIRRQLLSTLRDRARQALWEAHPLRVESREELASLIKYFLAQELKGQDLEAYARRHRLGGLIDVVARRLVRLQVPPEIMPIGGLTAAIQEVLRPRAPEAAAEQRRLEEAVLAFLPRSDCGSCGAPGCLAFARLLVRGQAAAAQCLQAPGDVKQRLEEIVAQSPTAAAVEPYVLTEDDCERLSVLLDFSTAALRERLARQFHGPEAQKLFPVKLDEVSILQVGKSPDAAAFHRYLADYLGLEAPQTLSARDRAFLAEYGVFRLAAEAKALEERFSWLAQESRSGLSVFALTPLDPAVQARQTYAACFFLSDLTPGDQKQVQEFRLRQYLDEFLNDWERALPEHWRAGYRIEDWDDFAQIVAKSFWHQEHTPASGQILRELPHEALHSPEAEHLAGLYLDKLVQEEAKVLERCRQRLELLLRERRVSSPEDLRILVQGLAVRTLQQKETGRVPDDVAASRRVSRTLELLDRAKLQISGDLRLHAEDLPFRVRELLAENPHLPPGETTRLESVREGLSWREMHTWQADLLRACLQAALEQLGREEQEVERLRRGNAPLVTPRLLRQAVRGLFWAGQRRVPDILENLEAMLAQCPDGQEWLNRLALRDYLWQLLEGGVFQKRQADAGPLTKALNHLLRAHHAHDVQKLKGYMYLLARMEGDLDRLTALLREIRETSDVIEAAWLAFTEERAAQKPEVAAAPGAPLPLSASQLGDHERFNRYLVDGLPRGEPRNYSQAYWELMTILEFYVVTAAPDESPETMYQRFVADNYDLTGLDSEAVQHALRHQAQHRQRLLPRKISICTEVLAHRLAKGNPDLARSAADFLRQKGSLLKDEGLAAELAKGRLAASRGVDLAKIKNELYAGIADLLTDERTESFTRRIGQIIDRLEEERRDTLAALKRGELNRLTAFYILRQFQKDQERVPPADLMRFLRRYQPEALAGLRAGLAPEVRAAADREVETIMSSYQSALEE
jgi:hypothetical protein